MCYAYDFGLTFSKGMCCVIHGNLLALYYLIDVAVNQHLQQVLCLLKERLVNGQNLICLDQLLKLSAFSNKVTFLCCNSHFRHNILVMNVANNEELFATSDMKTYQILRNYVQQAIWRHLLNAMYQCSISQFTVLHYFRETQRNRCLMCLSQTVRVLLQECPSNLSNKSCKSLICFRTLLLAD